MIHTCHQLVGSVRSMNKYFDRIQGLTYGSILERKMTMSRRSIQLIFGVLTDTHC